MPVPRTSKCAGVPCGNALHSPG